MDDAIELQLSCPHCKRPLLMRYIPIEPAHDPREYLLACPYDDCAKVDYVELYGSEPVVMVRAALETA
jgi:hypothetical protein